MPAIIARSSVVLQGSGAGVDLPVGSKIVCALVSSLYFIVSEKIGNPVRLLVFLAV